MKRFSTLLLLVVCIAGFYGCAGTAPTAEFRKPISDLHRLCPDDEVSVKITAAKGVSMNDSNRLRLESVLTEAIKTRKKSVPCEKSVKRSFVLDSTIVRYEKGNAVARLMLAGLGQIHLDGEFSLFVMPREDQSVAEFSVQKTFAWGGLYGGITRIEDVEPAFAESVAEAIVTKMPEKKDESSAN